MQWIDVRDRLPEIKEDEIYSDDVLIYDKESGFYVGNYTDASYWRAKETGCGCCSVCLNATHWAILPEKPNEYK